MAGFRQLYPSTDRPANKFFDSFKEVSFFTTGGGGLLEFGNTWILEIKMGEQKNFTDPNKKN